MLKVTICSLISEKYYDFLLKHIFQGVEICPVLNLGSFNHTVMEQIIRLRKMSNRVKRRKRKK